MKIPAWIRPILTIFFFQLYQDFGAAVEAFFETLQDIK